MRRPLAEDPAGALVEVRHRRPAEIAAARAVRLMGEIGTSLAAAEALDQTCLHTFYFGAGAPVDYLAASLVPGIGESRTHLSSKP